MFRPLLFEVIRMPTPDCYRLPDGSASETACADYLHELENVLDQHADRVAALIIEPLMQAAAGMVKHPPGFLAGVRRLTRKYEVLMIADEVAVGFGRTGTMFACEQEDVAPDLLCLGKGISGGYLPLAATLATTEIWNAFLGTHADSRTLCHGHTYGGNPLAAAVGLASLDLFHDDAVLDTMTSKICQLTEHLDRIAKHAHVGDVRQCGMIVGIELVQDRAGKSPFPWTQQRGKLVCDFALDEGVWVRPLGDVVVIMPPLSITPEELARICLAVEAGIQHVCP
jgi:adenosylmethionine-8-amino-7-oxononanoate aminotransferase